jgi:transposase
MGRPSLAPGQYFRLLLLGYFEGLASKRAIAWRAPDSLGVRAFLGLALTKAAPDHSTISRTRRLIDFEIHRAAFTWGVQCLGIAGLVKGKTIAIDATTLEANAILRSIVRCDTGESCQDFLTNLAQASGIETPTREDLVIRRLFKAHHISVKLKVFVVALSHFRTHRDNLEVSWGLLQDWRFEISSAGIISDTSQFLLGFFG